MDVPFSRRAITLPRKIVNRIVLSVCVLLVLHVWGVEPFEIPTGSMAPALLGNHRSCDCPSCGFRVVVGRNEGDRSNQAAMRCPNCGTGDLPLAETSGDRVLVYKSAFVFRRPRRWEIVVFRRNGKIYVKRILGLPGEILEIRDGDVYIEGELLRKTLEEARDTRILISEAYSGGLRPAARLESQKCGALTSEYTYNGRSTAAAETIHDFSVDCEIEVKEGDGTLRIGLTDGQDEVFADLPIGRSDHLVTWMRPHTAFADLPESMGSGGIAMSGLKCGGRYRLELAFVDRRVSIALDGKLLGVPIDLPPATRRQGVERPMYFQVKGAQVLLKSARLYRDLHYMQAGTNAVAGNTVRLAADQYFVLGDNSPNSEDSRFWSEHGVVYERDLMGKPFLVYFPSRSVSWNLLGRSWETRLPDFSRVRWLK